MTLEFASRWRSVGKTVLIVALAGYVMNFLMQHLGVMTVCSGVCLFLFAMLLLEQSFKALSSGILDTFLGKVADKNWKSFVFGFTLSTLVQSSGLVTVIAVSFLSAGLITLASGVAMVYGVNLSAACTTWIVGYLGLKAKISLYAMPFIIIGVSMCLCKGRRVRGGGYFFLSLGLLFLGISWMKEGFDSFKDSIDFAKYAMPGMKGLLTCTLIGLGVTAITQSSHATITLAITALSVGQIDYMTAVGISIGAAVGSTIFTVIGSLNANIEGKKIAVIHVFFKLLCAFVSIVFIDAYLYATDWLAPYLNIAQDDYVYKLAIIMSFYNVFGVIVLTPFIAPTCRVLNKVVRSNDTESVVDKPKYLNKDALHYANTALQTMEKESLHLLTNTLDIVARMVCIRPEDVRSSVHAHVLVADSTSADEVDFDEIYKNKFKGLYSDIIDYAVRATSSEGMDGDKAIELSELRRGCIIMAAAVKKAQQLNTNVVRYGFSSNKGLHEQYAHIRRNMVRMIRLVEAMTQAKSLEEIDEVKRRLVYHKSKFDAISSTSLDQLIRNKEISYEVATSIMNDNALSRGITKNLRHVAEILCKVHKHKA